MKKSATIFMTNMTEKQKTNGKFVEVDFGMVPPEIANDPVKLEAERKQAQYEVDALKKGLAESED